MNEVGQWMFIIAKPIKILVWHNVSEMQGRTAMRDGEWL
jgi:hypothetical protein